MSTDNIQAGWLEAMEAIRYEYFHYHSPQAFLLSDRAILEHPESPELWAINTHLLLWRGRREEARSTLQKALELGPDCALAWAARADMAAFEAHYDDAIEAAEEALGF